ncbi:upstream activation factor subunit spp27-like [Hibiscus syriacus]|uniref:upstream activation factor subunit spp27-like n=1 Tax=Hibiscus syriacus TaxID=106335 RepID=UPI00192403DC|nr:upstream activation factor subunit spp27-like [Hibiscus syriacus]
MPKVKSKNSKKMFNRRKLNQRKPTGSDSNEDDVESKKARNKRALVKKGPKRVNNEVNKRGGGFNKVCNLSPQLQELLGVPSLARTEVVKQVWAYFRERNLQDPDNKKNVICDESLHALFGVHSIDMFQMNKALSKHILPSDSDEVVSAKLTEKEKADKHQREADPDEPQGKEKRQKGFLAPLQLSDALVKFLGTGENELTWAVVIKRLRDYIKENNLQDPSEKRKVICDEKLKELFDVETFHGFTVTKILVSHFLKT